MVKCDEGLLPLSRWKMKIRGVFFISPEQWVEESSPHFTTPKPPKEFSKPTAWRRRSYCPTDSSPTALRLFGITKAGIVVPNRALHLSH